VKLYAGTFAEVAKKALESSLMNNYASSKTEALQIAGAVGEAQGKAEVYQERFNVARASAYESALITEDQRVRSEAVAMVDELFAANGVAKLEELPVVISSNAFGVSPGADVKLSMLFKNAGARQSVDGEIKVRLIETSSNLSMERSLSAVKSLPARKLVKTEADFGLKVKDDAPAGSKIRILAEVIYPGHEFNSQRIEKVEIQEVLGVNPSATVALSFDSNPKPTGFLGRVLIHPVEVSLTAKHAGMTKGYDVSMEEIGSSFASYNDQSASTSAVTRGQIAKATLRYKLSKSAKGKEIKFKITTKYDGKLVDEQIITVKAD
jgi:hypothetical protein